MNKSHPFARFTHLLKSVEELPIPMRLYNRHRMEYDYILGQISLSSDSNRELSVGKLTSCAMLGSQPTANKRIQELIQFGLIEARNSEDRRQKILHLTVSGEQYLQTCSELMRKVLSASGAPPDFSISHG